MKALIREMTGLPVVAAHELTTVLGYQERTVTAVLNARLIAIIDDLMDSVKAVLKEKGLEAPIMIVKGDGSLMNETIAREKPIDTILSGPAASIMGATFLDEIKEGLVVDMGGTTTDIAVLKNGLPRLDVEGARVGGWLTRVAAAEVNTFGLGGDSRISYMPLQGHLGIGPRRAWPVSYITSKYPYYLLEVEEYLHFPCGLLTVEPPDGLFILRKPEDSLELTPHEISIYQALISGPHTYMEIGRRIGVDANLIRADRLISGGYLGMIGLTPTDLLHATGEYVVWDREGALAAVAGLAKKAEMEVDAFISFAKSRVTEELCRVIISSALHYEGAHVQLGTSAEMRYFWQKAIVGAEDGLISCRFQLETPIIGIGAPVQAWLPEVSQKLKVPLVLPPHNDVANAVGAAVGKVMTIYRILIEPADGFYHVYAPWTRKSYPELEAAVNDIAAEARERMKEEMAGETMDDYDILFDRNDVYVPAGYGAKDTLLLKSVLEFVAVGRPNWQ